MQSGELIEFAATSGPRLGVVTGEVGKKKLIVMTRGGTEMRPAREDVLLVTGRKADPTSRAAMEDALASLEAQVEACLPDVDLELVWEMAHELEQATMTAQEIAEQVFGSLTVSGHVATLRALHADQLYFKARRDGYEVRGRAQVESLRMQLEVEGRKAHQRELVLSALTGALRLPEPDARAAYMQQRASEDDATRDVLGLLRDYGCMGDDFARKPQAEEWLDALDKSVALYGRGYLRAFDLMVKLGLWREHENIWLHRYHYAASHTPEVLAEAEVAATSRAWEQDPGRRDLTNLTTFSIDDASTRDIDDAISCAPTIEGGWEIGIHIADPSALIEPDSALEQEARRRSTSLYLPTGHIPMFPSILSEGAMSLVAGQRRPAITTRVVMDSGLQIIACEVFPSTIQVKHRLSYDEVDAMLMEDPSTPLAATIHELSFLTTELYERRMERGAVEFNIPEIKLHVADGEGGAPEVSCALIDTQSAARALVAEMMIFGSANMAEFCHSRGIPVIYRAQDAPDRELIDDELLKVPEGIARTFAMLRRMKRGSITTHPEPHFGLGLSMYVQATSPIRRYSDYICQRQVKAFLADQPLPYAEEEILRLAGMVEQSAAEARRIEQETVRYWMIYHLWQQRQTPLDAIVVDLVGEDQRRAMVFIEACGFRARCDMKRKAALGERVQVVARRANPREDLLMLEEA